MPSPVLRPRHSHNKQSHKHKNIAKTEKNSKHTLSTLQLLK